MTLIRKIKDKKVNFEFNKEYIKVVTDKIANNDAVFISNSFKEKSYVTSFEINPAKKASPAPVVSMTFPLFIDFITSITFLLIMREPFLPKVTTTNSHSEERSPWQFANLSFLNRLNTSDSLQKTIST